MGEKQIKVGGYRKRGAKVDYPRQQQRSYKSLEAREARAIELLNNWNRAVYHEPAQDSEREVYYFSSDRGDSCPYRGFNKCHVVSVTKELQPPALPLENPDPDAGPTGGGPPPTGLSTVFVANFGTLAPGLPPQIVRARAVPSFIPNTFISALPLPWIENEQLQSGVTIVSTNESLGLADIIAPPEAEGQTIGQLLATQTPFWVRFGKIYQFNTGNAIAVLFRWNGPTPTPPVYSLPGGWIEFPMPANTSTVLAPGTTLFPLGIIATPLGYDPSNPSPPEIDPAPPSPDDPGRADYACTCQDYSRKQAARDDSRYESEWSDRDWSDSDAGAPVDENTGIAYCKHVIATMMYRGEW